MIPNPSFTLTADSAGPYLDSRGFDTNGAHIVELAGGVSNVVVLVERQQERFVLKQALPQLRVEQEWFSDIRRIFTECAALQTVSSFLPPGSVPVVLFEDRANYLFAMTAAPAEAQSWKSQLLSGICDKRVAENVAEILGTMIRESWGSSQLRATFDDITAFEELRLDPYYGRLAKIYPELAERFEDLSTGCRTRRVSLVHGDWSPKNILAFDGRAMAIDFEVLHFGDPSFDSAFLLNHLLLKTFIGIAGAPMLAKAFWETLVDNMPQAPWFEEATLAHLGALLLARIDGKSPAEYVQGEELKQTIREFARELILSPPRVVAEVWERYDRRH